MVIRATRTRVDESPSTPSVQFVVLIDAQIMIVDIATKMAGAILISWVKKGIQKTILCSAEEFTR